MSQQNKALVRLAIEEVWSRGNYDLVDELYANDYAGHSNTGQDTRGPEGVKHFFADQRESFPDIRYEIQDQLADGDRVATRWTARGTHHGAFQGIPPTGKSGVVDGMTIYRIANGKVVECWTNVDALGLLQQLGVIPPMGQSGASA